MSRIISPVPLVLTISINQMTGEVVAKANREFNVFAMAVALGQLAVQYTSMGLAQWPGGGAVALPDKPTDKPTENPTEKPTEETTTKSAASHVAWLDAKEDQK